LRVGRSAPTPGTTKRKLNVAIQTASSPFRRIHIFGPCSDTDCSQKPGLLSLRFAERAGYWHRLIDIHWTLRVDELGGFRPDNSCII